MVTAVGVEIGDGTLLDRVTRAADLLRTGRYVIKSDDDFTAAVTEALNHVVAQCMTSRTVPPHWAIRIASCVAVGTLQGEVG